MGKGYTRTTLCQEHNKELVNLLNILLHRTGPLVRSWCMRYEAKRHSFKRLSVMLGNFSNLPFSLAKGHQKCML